MNSSKNKKAAKNTAISLTAKKYTLDRVTKIIGISADDCIEFLTLRHYIYESESKYIATSMSKMCINDKEGNLFITQEGLDRLRNAFYISPEALKKAQKIIEVIKLLE